MAKAYNHLTYEQRCQIFALKKSGLSQNKMAKQLGVAQSTISKELSRNSGQRGYRYKQAHEKSVERRQRASSVKRKMTSDFTFLIEQLIRRNKMSPEQISGRLRVTNALSISPESIYDYIWKDKKSGGDLYKNLRQQGKKRNKRGSQNAGRGLIPERVSIELRPPEVAAKERVGDWEADTIVGKNHRGAIVSMVERKTKLVRLKLLSSAKAEDTSKAISSTLNPLKKYVHTITTDNGKEFAAHKHIASSLDALFFFANPYRSWERGLNENTNGLVRQFFPKKTDFTKLTDKQIRDVEDNLNNRPRKLLNFKTPNEEFLLVTGKIPGYSIRS